VFVITGRCRRQTRNTQRLGTFQSDPHELPLHPSRMVVGGMGVHPEDGIVQDTGIQMTSRCAFHAAWSAGGRDKKSPASAFSLSTAHAGLYR